MNRFYVVLGVLAIALGVTLFALLRQGGGAAAAAAGPPPAVIDDGFRGYTLGSDDAVVEITEYSDFECPFCANFAAIQMPTIKEQLINTGKVRWRYRDFPLPTHQYSRYAAHAAHCAGEQGKFWDMHDQLFYHHQWAQTGKDPSGLFRDFAKAIGLDLARYDACMTAGRYASRIEFSREEGNSLLVNGTPTFFVNGKQFSRATSDAFKKVADSIIAQKPKSRSSAPPPTTLMRGRQAIALLALVGFFVAVYLWLHALGVGGPLKCGTGGCDTVQTSRWAVFLGLPVAFYGVVGYFVVLIVALLALRPTALLQRSWNILLAGLASVGVLFTCYLTYLELFVIHAICRWCVASAVIITVIWVLAVLGLKREWGVGSGTIPSAE